jgi:hypothetical protein
MSSRKLFPEIRRRGAFFRGQFCGGLVFFGGNVGRHGLQLCPLRFTAHLDLGLQWGRWLPLFVRLAPPGAVGWVDFGGFGSE